MCAPIPAPKNTPAFSKCGRTHRQNEYQLVKSPSPPKWLHDEVTLARLPGPPYPLPLSSLSAYICTAYTAALLYALSERSALQITHYHIYLLWREHPGDDKLAASARSLLVGFLVRLSSCPWSLEPDPVCRRFVDISDSFSRSPFLSPLSYYRPGLAFLHGIFIETLYLFREARPKRLVLLTPSCGCTPGRTSTSSPLLIYLPAYYRLLTAPGWLYTYFCAGIALLLIALPSLSPSLSHFSSAPRQVMTWS